MNLVGKIFIVLILIASTVFMTMGMMVYSTQHNWYDAITNKGGPGQTPGYKAQLQDARTESQQLKDEISKYDTALAVEKQTHFAALAKLETERSDLEKSRAVIQSQVDSQSKNLAEAATALKVAQDNLTALRTEETGLRDDIRQANKATDDQLKKATEAENRLNIAMGQLTDLKQRNAQLALDVAKAKLLLNKVGMTIEDAANGEPPTVHGRIEAIDNSNNVEITLGTDDGLRVGNTLEIYRGDKYLGRMQVLEAQPHRAVGKVIKELQQDVIRSGDQVATRLKA